MSWLAPAALAGALLVALPILIHMMGRGRTTVIRFPSLRFLEASRLLPARRTRIHDIVLLLIRAGVIVAAAVALAQPLFRVPSTAPVADAGVVRIVVLDTSASMQRAVQRAVQGTGGLGTGATAGERIADSLVNADTRVPVVRAADLRTALAGAAAWASTQSGRAEIAVVSDFQRGALDSATIGALDRALGIQLHRVRGSASSVALSRSGNASPVALSRSGSASPVALSRTRQGGADVSARIAFVGDRTDVEWTAAPPRAQLSPIQLRSGGAAPELVTATRRGAEAIGVRSWVGTVPAVDAAKSSIALVFPGDVSLAAVRANGLPLSSRRQAGIAVRLLNDPLVDAVSVAPAQSGAVNREVMAPESPVERVATTVENERPVLAVISRAPVGTAASAALLASLERAASTAPPVSELDPEVIPDATLATWQRAPGDRPTLKPSNPTDRAEFDGRWFWLLALLLLGVEALLRRAPRSTKTARSYPDANSGVNLGAANGSNHVA